MPAARPIESASLVLAVGVIAVAAALAYWLVCDRRRRGSSLSPADVSYFARQDFRRGLVSVLLVFLAVGVVIGSRLEHKIGGRVNARFVLIWTAIFVTIVLLLVLALFDWLSTRLYVRRHMRELARERIQILRDELRHRALHGGNEDRLNGPVGGTPPS